MNPALVISAVRQRYTLVHSAGAVGASVLSEVRSCPFVFCVQPGEVQETLTDSLSNAEVSPTLEEEFRVLDFTKTNLRVDTDVFLQAGTIGETSPKIVQTPGIDILFAQTQVPEPSTGMLLAGALAAIGVWKLRGHLS